MSIPEMTKGQARPNSDWIPTTQAKWLPVAVLGCGPVVTVLYGTFLVVISGGPDVLGGLLGVVVVFVGMIVLGEVTGLYLLETRRLRAVRLTYEGVEVLTFLGKTVRIPISGLFLADGKRGWGVLRVKKPRPRIWAVEPGQYSVIRQAISPTSRVSPAPL